MSETVQPYDRLTIRHIRKLSFSGLQVHDAMRGRVVSTEASCSIEESIRQLVKHKVAAMLVTDPDFNPLGVVSKTEIMGAFYAELPKEMMVQDIMSSPVLYCMSDDYLEDALNRMQDNKIHRLYVQNKLTNKITGTLAYPDIVGLLYRYCHRCEYGLQAKKEVHDDEKDRIIVREVMTTGINSFPQQMSLASVVEELAMTKFGALLMVDEQDNPSGVVSKTDLSLAYKRGVAISSPAEQIMSKNVYSCQEDEPLEKALRMMILNDLSRLFVYRDYPHNLTGILSLSDAARARSGSCQACASSRIIPK